MTSHGSRSHPLDHVVVVVAELDEAAGWLEEAGFLVTAQADHPFGTSNRLVMLDGVYIELMGVTRLESVPEGGFARYVHHALTAGRTGPMLFAFRSEDAEHDRRRMEGLGISVPDEPLTFGRDSIRPDGSARPVEFSVVVPDFAGLLIGSFICQHLTPEEVWHPSFRDHPNGATTLVRVDVADAGGPEWELMAEVADATGPPFPLANTTIDEGRPRLVVEAEHPAVVEIPGVTVEVTSRPG